MARFTPLRARLAWRFCLVLGGLLLVPLVSMADFVFLNDGFVLRGKVEQESILRKDVATGNVTWSAKLNGFYLVDDDARKIVFSQRNVRAAYPDRGDGTKAPEYFKLHQPLKQLSVFPLLQSVPKFTRVGEWDQTGRRELEGQFIANLTKRFQYITEVTPFAVRAGANEIRWKCTFLTDEFDPPTLVSILHYHLEQQAKAAKPPVDAKERRHSIFRFCLQAGWLTEAEIEMEALRKAGEDKKILDKMAGELRGLQLERLRDDLELALNAGQHGRVQSLLQGFTPENASEKAQNQIRIIQGQVKDAKAELEETRRLLTAVQKQAPGVFREALAEIEASLNPDTCGRLDAFRMLAKQEEQNAAKSQKSELSHEQLLALAVTGWIMGNNGADATVAAATKLWNDRQLMLKILATDDRVERQDLMKGILANRSTELDVIVQLIELLPPPQAMTPLPATNAELKTTSLSGEAFNYVMQLPPEYHHHRAYPLLIVLHNGGQASRDALVPWRKIAARYGFILVAPQWADPVQSKYRATNKEHDIVLGLIRDLRRRFNVDCSRTFLFGFGEGGTMAFDVGMSHPDLFAGVSVMCGKTGPHMTKYWANGQLLPFYIVEGEMNGPTSMVENQQVSAGPNQWRALLRHWVPRGYPGLYVEYDGRGEEFFTGEVKQIFEWMSRKSRVTGVMELGKIGEAQGNSNFQDFCGIRPTDNRFYWLSTEATPAEFRIAGRVSQNNYITVRGIPLNGVRNMTIWLHAGMVDFNLPVQVHITNLNRADWKNVVVPDVRVLLEDFYRRGDKRNLFVAKIELKW
jgi:pimeloyl-ACP methyl ester carboxylesterase